MLILCPLAEEWLISMSRCEPLQRERVHDLKVAPAYPILERSAPADQLWRFSAPISPSMRSTTRKRSHQSSMSSANWPLRPK